MRNKEDKFVIISLGIALLISIVVEGCGMVIMRGFTAFTIVSLALSAVAIIAFGIYVRIMKLEEKEVKEQ